MRARNIKPGLFKNEHLGTSDPINTVIFEGLWCLADREGRLEDRPLRIHAEINPYRPSASTVQALTWLHNHAFIVRYKASGVEYIAIPRFKEHQQPHIKEAASKIPEPTESMLCDITSASTVQAPCKNGERTVRAALIPDSGFPLPDSGFRIPDTGKPVQAPKPSAPPPIEFEDLKRIYPKRAGDQGWRKALKACHARLQDGYAWGEMIEGARRYEAFCRATGKTGTEFVKQASSFFGPDTHFLNPWELPANKAEVTRNQNIDASLQWLAEQEQQDAAR